MMTRKISLISAIFLTGSLLCTAAMAKDLAPAHTDLVPPKTTETSLAPGQETNGETHPPLRLTQDKSELVPLDREAGSVVIGNPGYISILVDSPKLAVVVPRMEGATYFTILDKEGKVIMQRHVIVGSPKKNYVRIRRSCSAAPQGTPCQPTSVYYCPDMCHEVGSAGAEDGMGTSSTSSQ